jgi:hypothetical protein
MSQSLLVFDDAVPVPDGVSARIGLEQFGSLLRLRRPLRDSTLEVVRAAGYADPIVIRTATERRALAARLHERVDGQRYVYLTADITASDPDHLRRVLAKLGWADHDVVLRSPDAPSCSVVASLGSRRLSALLEVGSDIGSREVWWRENHDVVERLPSDAVLLSLSNADVFTRYLAGALDTRAFNAMRIEGRVVRKYSADAEKMGREHDWYYLLPPKLQRFAVQPFDLQTVGEGASYRMERLRVPDAAIQWIHGREGLPDAAAIELIDAAFDWLTTRPVTADPVRAQAAAQQFYVTKVDERVSAFLSMPAGQGVDRLLRAGGHDDGVAGLVRRYRRHLDTAATHTDVTILHGDLCLSNILYDKRTGLLRLVDPRGARTEAELWGPASYDVAKLSHSLLGGYDFINQGLFDVVIDDSLRLRVKIQRPDRGEVASAFLERAAAIGLDARSVRTFEASLFLSMLPLHGEDSRKCLAFALAGAAILDELDGR